MIVENCLRNIFHWTKKYHPNVYSVVISMAVLFWVDGFLGILSYYVVHPNTPLRHLIVLLTGLMILYLNDGTFSELYNVNDDKISDIIIPAGAGNIIN